MGLKSVLENIGGFDAIQVSDEQYSSNRKQSERNLCKDSLPRAVPGLAVLECWIETQHNGGT